MTSFNTSAFPFQSSLLAGLMLAASVTSAASACKGLEQNACAASGDCIWVDSYVRKDGRSVSSHCKLGGGGKNVGQASPDGVKLGQGR